MAWTIPFTSTGFTPALSTSFRVDELDIFWAALTVGRPNRYQVYRHGQFSIDEATFRLAVVRANLQLETRTSGLLHSSAFRALDPTEKGWTNFSLGMLFAKIFAAKYLDAPWLIHFKWFATHYPVTMHNGGSTPDFIGFSPASGDYHVLEAKGRSGGLSNPVLASAKDQARMPIRVHGQVPATRVGTLLYRVATDRLAFACADPDELEGEPIKLKETLGTWQQYYRIPWALHTMGEDERAAIRRLTGVSLKMNPEIAKVVGRLISLEEDSRQDWRRLRNELVRWASNQGAGVLHRLSDDPSSYRQFPDGCILSYQPPESAKRSVE